MPTSPTPSPTVSPTPYFGAADVDNLAGGASEHASSMSAAYDRHVFSVVTSMPAKTFAVGAVYVRVGASSALDAVLRLGTERASPPTAVGGDVLSANASVRAATVAGETGYFLVADLGGRRVLAPSDVNGTLWIEIDVAGGWNYRLDVGSPSRTGAYYQNGEARGGATAFFVELVAETAAPTSSPAPSVPPTTTPSPTTASPTPSPSPSPTTPSPTTASPTMSPTSPTMSPTTASPTMSMSVFLDNLAGGSSSHPSDIVAGYNYHLFNIFTGLTGPILFGNFYFRVLGPDSLTTRTRLGSNGADSSYYGVNSPYIEATSCAVSYLTILGETDNFLACDFGRQTLDVPSDGTLWLSIQLLSGSNQVKDVGPSTYTNARYQEGYSRPGYASFALWLTSTPTSSPTTSLAPTPLPMPLTCSASESLYSVTTIDREGDGWRNASWAIVDATTRAVAASGTLATGYTENELVCLTPGCVLRRLRVRDETCESWRARRAVTTCPRPRGGGGLDFSRARAQGLRARIRYDGFERRVSVR